MWERIVHLAQSNPPPPPPPTEDGMLMDGYEPDTTRNCMMSGSEGDCEKVLRRYMVVPTLRLRKSMRMS